MPYFPLQTPGAFRQRLTIILKASLELLQSPTGHKLSIPLPPAFWDHMHVLSRPASPLLFLKELYRKDLLYTQVFVDDLALGARA